MAYDLVVERGRIVVPEGVFEGNVGILDGRIAAISANALSGKTVLNAEGLIVMPGVVDLHAHFNEPGRGHWEGWTNGSLAAVSGGVTTVVEMPLNAVPATTSVANLEAKLNAIGGKSYVDFGLWGGFVDDNRGDLEALSKSGVIGFKAFLVDTRDDTFRWVDYGLLEEGMRLVAATGLFLAVHAEDNSIVGERTSRLRASGRNDLQAWNEARPPEAELTAVREVLRLGKKTGCPVHIVHVSLPETVNLLNEARSSGQTVSFETCPHYLTFTQRDLVSHGAEFKCAPPLRDEARREALWDQILAGGLDCVTSDHSPCPTQDKTIGGIWETWGGITGVQSLLTALLTEGFHSRRLPLEKIAYVSAARPAQLAGFSETKGTIRVGGDADLVLVDLERSWKLQAGDLKSLHRHSAYVGRTFRGWIDTVFVRGHRVVSAGRIVGQPVGRWLKRMGSAPKI